jgi:hypothetical protein
MWLLGIRATDNDSDWDEDDTLCPFYRIRNDQG